ncbi:unnamed protein product [Blepharisma stoltei]|uniref:Cyclin N-terminal domain-containing protein n=1 Tax=Blepharisma stoltei TaxID=1481888 RepID=A0AAU9K0Y2_9CILI|nr:unnamed protein product [Blepharisma stoltei]
MKNPKKSSKKSSKSKIIKNLSSPDILHCPIPVKPSTYFTSNQKINSKQILDYDAYKLMRDAFKLSHKGAVMLRRCVIYSDISTEIRRLPLLTLLTETAEEMVMNDLEIAVWSIYLKRFVWDDINQPFKAMLYITALAVKSYMNLSVQPFKAYLVTKIPNFSNIYNCWAGNRKNALSIFPQELNRVYKSLSKPVISQDDLKLIDYNYYVDDILELAPSVPHKPHNVLAKEKALETIKEVPENFFINMEAYKEIEPTGILLGKKDSIFSPNLNCETPTLATSWSYMSAGSKSGQETACFDNSDSDVKNQGKHDTCYGELPAFNPQQSLFSSYWNAGKLQEDEKHHDEEIPMFASQKSLFSSFWNTQPTK